MSYTPRTARPDSGRLGLIVVALILLVIAAMVAIPLVLLECAGALG